MKQIYDMLIIGGGPAGYTAALYAARAGLRTAILEKMSPGGQMALTSHIDNYPGFPEGIDGFTLGDQMRQGAERFGAESILTQVLSVELEGSLKTVRTDSGIYQARTVVFATGAEPRKLGIPGEQLLQGRGLHYCAHCDGMFYRGKTVAVIGGGNSAVADALYLARISEKVILIHRRDTLRATKVYHQALQEAQNIEIRWNSAPTELLHDQKLTGIRIRDTVTGEEAVIPCDGVFVSVGRSPSTELVAGQLHLDGSGYVIADETTRTNIPGVFAAGDVRTTPLRQIVTATADGAMAAHFAEQYLSEQ